MKNKLQKLSIEGIEIYSNHGVYDFEKNSQHLFIVDVFVYANFLDCMMSDQLEDTIDYQIIHKIVSQEMAIHSDLIEHLAYRIALKIKEKLNTIDNLTLKISKMNPPLEGLVAKTTFEINL